MQNLRVIRETSFVKGYNDKLKPELLPEEYCADALNCWLDDQTIKKRNGYSIAGNDPSIAKPILSLGAVKPGGTEYLWRARDTADGSNAIVEYWSGSGNWTTVTGAASQTAGKDHIFVTANNVAYIINDTDTVLKSTNGTSTATVATFPQGVDAAWFHNYMFVITAAGVLYWSSLNAPETWDTTNDKINVNINDGDTCVGFGILKDELLIFKKNRVWSLTGFGTADFTVDDMGERLSGLGAQSRRSIISTGNDVYFLSHAGDIPHFRSVLRTRYGQILAGEVISDLIEATMKRLVVGQEGNCVGIFDGRKIWWAVTTSGTANNEVVVYDTLTKGWTRHTGINSACFSMSTVSGGNVIYFGEATSDTLCYKLDTSTSDNGTAIDMQFKTRLYNPFPENKCKWKYLQLACDVESAATLDIDYAADGFEWNDLDDLTLAGTGGTFPLTLDTSRLGTPSIIRHRIDSAGGTSYKIQYRFRNNTATDDLVIREYQLLYKPRGLRAVAEG